LQTSDTPHSLRIIFAGTPEFAADCLAATLNSRHSVCAVYTQPDRPAGRGRQHTPSAVKQLALRHDLPVLQPLNFKEPGAIDTLTSHQADVMVVVAYGLLLPTAVLDAPRLGCLNVHASLLPRWRGAAPIQRAIAAGDRETGVTLMRMDAGLDTGPMVKKAVCGIRADDTGGDLHDRLAVLGAETLVEVLDGMVHCATAAQIISEPQPDDGVTYAHKLSKADAAIDWQQSAACIERCIRAFNPWPVAHTQCQQQTVRVWEAERVAGADFAAMPGTLVAVDRHGLTVATGTEPLRLTRIQLPGKKPLAVRDVLNAQVNTTQKTFEVGGTLG